MMYNYKIKVYPIKMEDGIEWVARFPEVNNIGGGGDTPEDAIKNAYENLEFELECLKEEGKPVPLPSYDLDFSGRISLRLSKVVHKMANDCALEEGISLNQFISNAVAEAVGMRKGGKYAYLETSKTFIESLIKRCMHETSFANKSENLIKIVSEMNNINTETLNAQIFNAMNQSSISKEINKYAKALGRIY